MQTVGGAHTQPEQLVRVARSALHGAARELRRTSVPKILGASREEVARLLQTIEARWVAEGFPSADRVNQMLAEELGTSAFKFD